MKKKNIIFVDGIATREACDIKAGQPHGIKKLCEAAGVSPVSLHEICRNGYGTPLMIEKYSNAGLPIIGSTKPVPCRLLKEHTKNRKEKTDPEKPETETFKLGDENIEVPVWSPKQEKRETKQISFEDFTGETKADQMKKIIIKGLTEIITELYKL